MMQGALEFRGTYTSLRAAKPGTWNPGPPSPRCPPLPSCMFACASVLLITVCDLVFSTCWYTTVLLFFLTPGCIQFHVLHDTCTCIMRACAYPGPTLGGRATRGRGGIGRPLRSAATDAARQSALGMSMAIKCTVQQAGSAGCVLWSRLAALPCLGAVEQVNRAGVD